MLRGGQEDCDWVGSGWAALGRRFELGMEGCLVELSRNAGRESSSGELAEKDEHAEGNASTARSSSSVCLRKCLSQTPTTILLHSRVYQANTAAKL